MDRAPVAIIDAGGHGNGTSTLGWDNAGSVCFEGVEVRLDLHSRGIYAFNASMCVRVKPFDHARIVLFPAGHEQALFREFRLRIKDDDLAGRVALFQQVRDH